MKEFLRGKCLAGGKTPALFFRRLVWLGQKTVLYALMGALIIGTGAGSALATSRQTVTPASPADTTHKTAETPEWFMLAEGTTASEWDRIQTIDAGTMDPPWSVALGVDIMHTTGSPYLELRYSGRRWRHWSAYLGLGGARQLSGKTYSPRMGAELYKTWFKDRLITGLGLSVAPPDEIVATRLRWALRFGWVFRTGLSLEFLHESNCSEACDNSLMSWLMIPGAKDGPNLGYNWAVIRIPL